MQTYQVYVIVFGQQMTTEIEAESEQDLLQQVQQQTKETLQAEPSDIELVTWSRK